MKSKDVTSAFIAKFILELEDDEGMSEEEREFSAYKCRLMRDLYMVIYNKTLVIYQKKNLQEWDEVKDDELLGYKLRFRVQDVLRIQKQVLRSDKEIFKKINQDELDKIFNNNLINQDQFSRDDQLLDKAQKIISFQVQQFQQQYNHLATDKEMFSKFQTIILKVLRSKKGETVIDNNEEDEDDFLNNSFDFNENFKECQVEYSSLNKIFNMMGLIGADNNEYIEAILEFCKKQNEGKDDKIVIQDLISFYKVFFFSLSSYICLDDLMSLIINQTDLLFLQMKNLIHEKIQNILHPPPEPVQKGLAKKIKQSTVIPEKVKTPLNSLLVFNRLLDYADYEAQVFTDDRVLMENSLKMKKLSSYIKKQGKMDQNQVQVYIQMKLTKNNDYKEFYKEVLDQYAILNILVNNLKHMADEITL